uniref:Uncharacterized protein n=1 Tax=Oryza meridionalis TaxID=40149 RepID=A0A0E0ENH4_9ORYZ
MATKGQRSMGLLTVREATMGTNKNAMGSFVLHNDMWALTSGTNPGAMLWSMKRKTDEEKKKGDLGWCWRG